MNLQIEVCVLEGYLIVNTQKVKVFLNLKEIKRHLMIELAHLSQKLTNDIPKPMKGLVLVKEQMFSI